MNGDTIKDSDGKPNARNLVLTVMLVAGIPLSRAM